MQGSQEKTATQRNALRTVVTMGSVNMENANAILELKEKIVLKGFALRNV